MARTIVAARNETQLTNPLKVAHTALKSAERAHKKKNRDEKKKEKKEERARARESKKKTNPKKAVQSEIPRNQFGLFRNLERFLKLKLENKKY